MAWKKYFKDANLSPIAGDRNPQFAKRNYSSYLPDVYTGHPNRIQRYFQYDQMDSDWAKLANTISEERGFNVGLIGSTVSSKLDGYGCWCLFGERKMDGHFAVGV